MWLWLLILLYPLLFIIVGVSIVIYDQVSIIGAIAVTVFIIAIIIYVYP